MTAETVTYDNSDAAAEAFLDRTCEIIDAGAQSVMISIGHRTGLFDTLADRGPSTSQEIADAAGLAERYVREWLAALVTAGILVYGASDRTYYLPKAHAASLTRGGALGNMAVYAQHVALMGAVQENVLQCFRTGEGTSYGDYPCFHQMMAEDSDMTVVDSLFEDVLALVCGIEDRLVAGIDVLDAGCGSGHALIAMAERFPASRFTGYDLSPDAVADARETAVKKELSNVRFEAKDMSDFDEPESFDFITTFDAVHDQKDPQGLLTGIYGALRPGGVYLMQDVGGSAHLESNLDFPMASFLYAVSLTHCTPVSIGQGGPGLGTMWGWETAQAMLEAAGFRRPELNRLPHDPMNVWFVSRK